MGLSAWKVVFSHSTWTEAQVFALYVGCPGWQTAPGGDGWSKRPEMELLRLCQADGDGHDGEPGVALQDWVLPLAVAVEATITTTICFHIAYILVR